MDLWKNRNFKPMLLKELDEPFDSNDYIFELKYDGIRALCFVNSKEIFFISRNNIDLTSKFPELMSIKEKINNNVIFDGEIVSFEKNVPSFSKVVERVRLKNNDKILFLSKNNPVVFVVFDILYENNNLINLNLIERKKILNKYKDTNNFVKSFFIEKNGIKLFNEIKKKNLEGIVAKNKNSTYHINKRTDDFIKIKNIKRDEFYIFGYKIKDKNISLILGEYKNSKMVFNGKCSLSKNSKAGKKILKMSKSEEKKLDIKEDFINIKPIKCYVEYAEKTKNNNLRHPVFKGFYERN